MRYELYFRGIKIGVVAEDDSDFPNLWGTIIYDESLAQPTTEEQKRLATFLELNRDSNRLLDIEDEQDVSGQLAAIDKQLASYNEYIETDDWILITAHGEAIRILCPFFRSDGGIVWRWNPSKGKN